MNYEFDFDSALAHRPMFLDGAWMTLQMPFRATLAGFVIGVLCAVARSGGPPWLRRVAGAYAEAIRNTPLLMPSHSGKRPERRKMTGAIQNQRGAWGAAPCDY
ncbi:MAG: ABC transporter permease subunit [Pollutimonas bauzanensis]|uniref:Amine acid ABC transporter, permease protein, 3-TM region, His/Glu/Gln/Arg/opine family n=1 Tax=Pollutimonas bauzanensis TaxID=658167 RepID=A0A1M5NGR3_9BURK|nr:ABC transporter permease subunit [Pollutimonas bauzanensis]SHG88710.1 amine acid ABC transporter, permease protein, 3-TM region, His/Glu/Gln/Arg/opine family [Pollutimonas bauzanensis]